MLTEWNGYKDGKILLERCDKLLHSIAEMNNASATESPPSSAAVLPSPVSVLDPGFDKDESSSPSYNIHFKGMGTEVHCKSSFEEYYSMRDVNEDSNCSIGLFLWRKRIVDKSIIQLASSDGYTADRCNTPLDSTHSSGEHGRCFIQAAWWRHCKRKMIEQRHKEELEMELAGGDDDGGSRSLGTTFLLSKFAANALRGVHRNPNVKTGRELVNLPKPLEPDFTADDD